MDTSKELLSRTQSGDADAANLFMRHIRDTYVKGVVRQYGRRNVLVTEADIESEFLLGCWKATLKAKPDVGNPIKFIVWKGRMEVASLFRSRITSGVRYTCFECGSQGKVRNHGGAPACNDCNSRDLWTTMYEVGSEAADRPSDDNGPSGAMLIRAVSGEHAWQLATYGIQVEEMRARLTGRVRDLFDLLIIEGVNRDSSRNYLKEIGQRWGVSTTAVAATLRRLRTQVLEYCGEN